MSGRIKVSFTALIMFVLQGVALQAAQAPAPAPGSPETNLAGRWRVTFILAGVKKNLIFDSRASGSGSFLLLDTGLDDKPVATPVPAAWSRTTNDRVSFSGEAELPIGTCCREIGTVIFKGRFESINSISGKVVFVTSVDDEESPLKLRSASGSFIASRILDHP